MNEKDQEVTKQKIKEARNETTNARNIMGVSENWYDSYYAISKTFTDEEIDNMSERELDYLIRLTIRMGEAFY